ncbi:MAG: C39 family peptidase, partial [Actinobacteria bacterium]|nr:C39 family peptidase [Actinomycetota bacterium]
MKVKFNFFLFLLFLTFLILPNKIEASTLFEDDFQSGLSKWNIISGADIWETKEIYGSLRFGGKINSGNTIISAIAGEESWDNYIFEVDILPIYADDKNIMFRWTPQRGFCNQFHFNSAGIQVNYRPEITNYFMTNGSIYHVKIILNENRYILYIDDQLLIDFTNSYESPPCLNGSIGLTISTGSSYPSEVWFDNVKVSTIDDEVILNVPDIKQTSNPWANQEYDSAKKWAPNSWTIANWGCALTSATMVLNYLDTKKLPNGLALHPGTLNEWLRNEIDGYIREGWINWLAISRLTKKANKTNDIENFNALEYERIFGSNSEMLLEDIKVGIPDILEEPGHFVVGKGFNENTFKINDPYYSMRTDLTSYSNSFLSLGRYIPSKTDLSYIMIASDNNVTITVKDDDGNYQGQQFFEESLKNEITDENNAQSIRIFYLKKPKNGSYMLEISAQEPKITTTNIYLYDITGNVKKIDVKDLLYEKPSFFCAK